MEKSDDYKLQTSWILWNHKLNDNNWKNNSYKNIFEINNLYDYKFLENIMTLQNLQNTMFFLMRKDIFPTWEDPDNRDGCCASFKVPLKDIRNIWIQLVIDIISENIHIDKNKYDVINGISIAPKKEFNIIKLWVNKNNLKIFDLDRYINPKNGRIKRNIV